MRAAKIICVVFGSLVAVVVGVLLSENNVIHVNTKKAVRLQEALIIEGGKLNSYSLLPAGTVLYYDKSWAEGHSTYHVYFHFKGDFKSEPADASGIDPIWLRTIDAGELPVLVSEYPVSRADLTNILKAKRATKQDVEQILRDWKD